MILEAYSQIKEEHDSCMDRTEVAMAVTYDAIWNGVLDLKKNFLQYQDSFPAIGNVLKIGLPKK
jgi:hypothetical protein